MDTRSRTTLPAAVTTPAAARAFVKDAAADVRVPLEDLTLLVSELVTNAVVRGVGDVDVDLVVDDATVHVEVADQGPDDPIPAEPDNGMILVSRLARRWGVRKDGDRTVLWADLAAV